MTRSVNSRHAGDVARVIVGLAVLLLAALAVRREQLSQFEADVFRLINHLPSVIEPVVVVVMQAGNVVAAPILGGVVVAFNRKRLRAAVDVAVAGGVAWIAAKAIKGLIERPRPTGFLSEVLRFDHFGGLGFVSGHTAVAAAISTAAAPYLTRRWKRAIWFLPLVVGFARVYVGAHLPLDIAGGAALGWIVGACIHLLLGAPHRVPELSEAAHMLTRSVGPLVDLERVPGHAKGSFPFTASTADGRVFIKLLDPESRDRDWIYRAARFLSVRDVRDEAAILDGSGQAYHEVAMALLARSAGVRVPAVRGIEHDGDRIWIVQDCILGRTLPSLDPAEMTDPLLDSLWSQLRLLRTARVAHRDLVGTNIIRDDAGEPWIVDFAHAQSAASTSAMDNDAAELLMTTAVVAGPQRAVAAAARALDRDETLGVLAELQPLALTPESRRAIAEMPDLLGELRNQIAASIGAEADGVDNGPLPRSGARTLRSVAFALVVGGALVGLAGVTDVASAVRTMSARWLALAVVGALVARVAASAAFVEASGRRLAVGRTAIVQTFAFSRSVLLTRTAGDRVLMRYLARAGARPAGTYRALMQLAWSQRLSLALALGVGVAAAWEEKVDLRMPPKFAVLAALAAAALVLQLVVSERAHTAPSQASAPGRRLGSPAVMFRVGIAVTAELATTVAVVSAFGPGPAAGTVVVIAITGSMLGIVFAEGGAVDARLIVTATALSAAGMPLTAAVAAAVTVSLLEVWVPVAVGRLVARPLRRALGR